MRRLWARTLAFQVSSFVSASSARSADARLEMSRSSSASTVSTRLPSLDKEQTFAVAGKKERSRRRPPLWIIAVCYLDGRGDLRLGREVLNVTERVEHVH